MEKNTQNQIFRGRKRGKGKGDAGKRGRIYIIISTINLYSFILYLTFRLPAGEAFFSLLAQRKESKERAAAPLRLPRSATSEIGGARTRCAQTACPFFRFQSPPPGSAPMAPLRPRILSPGENSQLGGMGVILLMPRVGWVNGRIVYPPGLLQNIVVSFPR